MGDLTRLSMDGNGNLAELPNRSTSGLSSRSSDSIFDRLDKDTDNHKQHQFAADSGGAVSSVKENENKDSLSDDKDDDGITISRNGSSSQKHGWPLSVHASETETNSDVELDFILPQSEDFLQVKSMKLVDYVIASQVIPSELKVSSIFATQVKNACPNPSMLLIN